MSVAVSSGGDYDGLAPSSASKRRSPSASSVVLNVETIRLHLSSVAARLSSRVSVDTLRPFPMFLGVTPQSGACVARGAFTSPIRSVDKASLEKVRSRFSLNFAFFLTNYALVAAMVGLVVALMHPGMLFFVGVCYGLWTFHAFLIRHELELFGIRIHSLLSIQQRFYLNFAVTSAVVVWKCLKPALLFAVLTALLVSSHALLRDPKHIEAMDSSAARDAALLSASGGAGALLRGEGSNNNGHSSDDDEEANAGSSSGGSSGSEKGAVLVERPTVTKRRGEVI